MKGLFGILLLLGLLGASFKKAGLINTTVVEAQKLYRQEKYESAIQKYLLLNDSLEVTDPELKLNLAHAFFQTNNISRSRKYYQELTKNPDEQIGSVALTQLAVLDFEKGNSEKALYHLKRAIIQNPQNEEARYNYELLKKYLLENPPGSPTRKNNPNTKRPTPPEKTSPAKPSETGNEGSVNDNSKTGENPAQNKADATGSKGGAKNQDPDKNNIGEGNDSPVNKGRSGNGNQSLGNEENGAGINKSSNPGTDAAEQNARQIQTLRVRLRKTDLPPEKAMQLLEAMRNAELQYLQQVPRKATTKGNTGGPDY